MTELLLIRHGETAWNAERRLQGYLNIALNSVGVQQARLLASALQGDPPDVIISSDLQRARATAAPLAQIAAVEMIVDTALRERCFGAFEGLRYDEINHHYSAAHTAWQARELDACFPPRVDTDGIHPAETLREFSRRAVAAVLSHLQRHRGKKIAIVTHGGVLDCVYRFSTGMPLEKKRDFEIANASVNRFHWEHDKLTLLQWGDVSHLPAVECDAVESVVMPGKYFKTR